MTPLLIVPTAITAVMPAAMLSTLRSQLSSSAHHAWTAMSRQ